MYNLQKNTGHEAGIIIYESGDVAVYNWTECGDNEYPLLAPWGSQINWPDSKEEGVIRRVRDVDDVRPHIPEEAKEPVYDANGDLPVLLGEVPDTYLARHPEDLTPYSGTIWELVNGEGDRMLSIITIDGWN